MDGVTGPVLIGLVGLTGVVVLWAMGHEAARTRTHLSRRLDRISDKVDLLLEEAGLAEPPVPRQDEIVALVRAGKKIQAIKVYRQATGETLVEAKNAVERLS